MASKKKSKSTPAPDRNETIEVKHEFSDTERIGLLDELSRAHHELSSLKEQKKNSMGEWSNRIKAIELKIKSISDKAQSGYEMIPTEASVKFRPKDRKKDYYVAGKKVETRDMTDADFEMELFEQDKPINPVSDAFPSAEEGNAD